MPYPNLVLIGPPKCGTTSVFNWLESHPDVCTSTVKETYFFFQRNEEENGIRQFNDHDFTKYLGYFKSCNKATCIVEATPEYLYSQSAIEAFKQINEPIKFLFIYRDPADRMFSDYQFHRYKTKRFKGSFQEYVGYKNGSFIGKKVQLGHYKKYLDLWIEAFGNERIIQMSFDDLREDPIGFMENLASQINLDPKPFETINLSQKNKTVKIKNRKLHLTLLKVAELIPKKLVNLLSPIYYKLNSGSVPKKSDEQKRLINELRTYYQAV